MAGWDASLHLVELVDNWRGTTWAASHPLYPTFPLFDLIKYDAFWFIFWSIAAILAFTLIFSRKNVTKNINNIYMPAQKVSEPVQEETKIENKVVSIKRIKNKSTYPGEEDYYA